MKIIKIKQKTEYKEFTNDKVIAYRKYYFNFLNVNIYPLISYKITYFISQ